MNDESTPDRSYSLYQVFTLTAQTYTESLLNDGNAHDDRFYNLYWILTLMSQIYTELFLMVALITYIMSSP